MVTKLNRAKFRNLICMELSVSVSFHVLILGNSTNIFYFRTTTFKLKDYGARGEDIKFTYDNEIDFDLFRPESVGALADVGAGVFLGHALDSEGLLRRSKPTVY